MMVFRRYFEVLVATYKRKKNPNFTLINVSKTFFYKFFNRNMVQSISRNLKLPVKTVREALSIYYNELHTAEPVPSKKKQSYEGAAFVPPSTSQKALKLIEERELKRAIERRKSQEALLAIVPEAERPFFEKTIIAFNRNPTPTALNQISKAIDRYRNIYETKFRPPDIIPYKRPTWLAPKQNMIADKVQLNKNYLVHGERQTGKDTSIAVGIFELLISVNLDHPVYFMASSLPTAIEVMSKILSEERFSYLDPFIVSRTKFVYTFRGIDGTFFNQIKVIATTEAAVKGITGILWIDDIDTIIKNLKEDVITKAAAITRSSVNIRFIFTSNMGKGAYLSLLEEWQKDKWKDFVEVIELKVKDVNHINAEKDEFLWATMKALSGADVANEQMYNIADRTAEQIPIELIEKAMNDYEIFFAAGLDTPIRKKILSIDPSGFAHPIGWFLGGVNLDGSIFEIKSGLMRLARSSEDKAANRDKMLWDDIKHFFRDIILTERPDTVVIENNSSGLVLIPYLNSIRNQADHTYNVQYTMFGKPNTWNSHENHINLVNYLFNDHKITFKNDILKAQLRTYNPFLGKDTLYKGDLADAFMHCVWKLAGGKQALVEYNKIRAELEESIYTAVG